MVDVYAQATKVAGDDRGDVLVLEGQDARLLIDDADLGTPEVGEHRGVLAADDTRAEDDHALWEVGQVLDVVAGEDVLAIDVDARRPARRRTGGDKEVVG